MIQPDSVGDDLRRESGGDDTGWAGTSSCQFRWPPTGLPDPVTVTIPFRTESFLPGIARIVKRAPTPELPYRPF